MNVGEEDRGAGGSELGELEAIRARRRYLRHWSPRLEARFRRSQRNHHRIMRTSLFAVLAIAWGLAPLYGTRIFAPSIEITPSLFGTVHAIGAALAGIAVLVFRWPHTVPTRVAQVVGVVLTSLCALLLQYLGAVGAMDYSPLIVCSIVVAFTAFGGYPRTPMLIGTVFIFTGSLIVESWIEPSRYMVLPRLYGIFLMMCACTASVLTRDYLARLAWVSHRYASLLGAIDPLTGLGTRAELNRVIEARFRQAGREGRRIGLLLLDVDHFKQINDRYGHLFGDEVLRAVGHCLRDGFARRAQDLQVRFGGEELLVLWYDIEPGALVGQTQRLMDAIRALPFVDPVSAAPVRISASAGGVHLVPGGHESTIAVLRKADELLYEAKLLGRDRAVVAAFEAGNGTGNRAADKAAAQARAPAA